MDKKTMEDQAAEEHDNYNPAAIKNQNLEIALIMCAAAQRVLGYTVARVGSYFPISRGHIWTDYPNGTAPPGFILFLKIGSFTHGPPNQ